MIQSYTQITGKYLKANKKRTILTIIGVILSVALISSIGLFVKGIQDAEIETTKAEFGSYHLSYKKVTESLVTKVKNNPKVSRSGMYLQGDSIKLNDKLSATEIEATDKALELLPIKAKKGRFPKNEKEIAVENWVLRYIDKDAKIGGKINVSGKEYTLVGVLEDNVSSQISENGITLTINNKMNVEKAKLLIEVSSKTNIKDAVKELETLTDKDSYEENEYLLMMEGASTNDSASKSILMVVGIIIGIVVIATIAVIYNAFQISVVERMKQFGLLRAVGTTPKQIRKIVLREATFIILIGVPIGLVCGIIAIEGISLAFSIIGGESVSFIKLSISPMIMLISAIIGVASVYISALLPALHAGRISPLMAISSRSSIKKEKIKRRNNFIAQKLFGFEGALASKNIKRNRKRYRITVFSIVLSVTLFIAFKSFSDMTLNVTGTVNEANDIHFSIHYNEHQSSMNDVNTQSSSAQDNTSEGIDNNLVDSIKSIKYVKTVYKAYSPITTKTVISKDKEIKQVDNIKLEDNNKFYGHTTFQGQEQTTMDTGIIIYDENSFNAAKKYVKSGSIDLTALNNEDGVIVIGKGKIYNYKTNVTYVGPAADIKAGDEIYIKTKDLDSSNISDNSCKKVKVMAVLSDGPFSDLGDYRGLRLITTEQIAKKLFGKEANTVPTRLNVVLKSTNDEVAANAAIDNAIKSKPSLEVLNYIDMNKHNKAGSLMVQILLYGFVIVISLISSVNILNTITTNIILRRREFATLKSIGLTQKGLKKMIVLEGMLYGIMGAIYGSIVGCGLSYLLYKGIVGVREFGWSIPWTAIIIASVCSLAIGYLSVLSPLSKIKRDNLIEVIREE